MPIPSAASGEHDAGEYQERERGDGVDIRNEGAWTQHDDDEARHHHDQWEGTEDRAVGNWTLVEVVA